ncbi:MAG: multidrug efflux MFS transporter [Chloroflexota bacterium]|nr:multidrug efflux MFS transporter [Chloroflexota bacterium]
MSRLEYKWIVALLAVFAIFMEVLDSTVVNVAVPTLGRDFHVTTASTIQWVITGYLLSLAVFIPVSGWAADRFGSKRVFMFALTVFTGSSLLCALAWSVESLIGFRVLQGVGGGMLSPVAFSTLWRAFPPAERSKVAGIMVVPAAVAPASGPIVGGALLKWASWEWIFLVNVPIGVVALVISAFYLKEHKEPQPGRFDPAGFVLSAAGLASLLYALSQAGSRGFNDGRVALFGLGGIALIAAFALVELRAAHPMIDIRLLKDRLFRACNLAWFVMQFGFGSMIFLLTFELQATRGLSALESGLTTFPQAIGLMLVAQPASRIYRVVGPRRMIATGLLVTALSTLTMSRFDLETSEWLIRGLMMVRGLGFGLVLVPLQAATYATVPPAITGRATALYQASQQVAASLGVAVVAALLTSRLAHHGAQLGNPATSAASLHAFQDGFVVMGLLSLAGVLVALLIRDRDAEATMNPRTSRVVTSPEVEAAAGG